MNKIYVTVETEAEEKIFNCPINVLTDEDKEIVINILHSMIEAVNALDAKVNLLFGLMQETASIDQEFKNQIAAILRKSK